MKIYHWSFHTKDRGIFGITTLFNSKKTAIKKFEEWIIRDYGWGTRINLIKIEKKTEEI